MKSLTRTLGILLLGLGASGCTQGAGTVQEDPRVETLEAHIEGLEAFISRHRQPTAPSTTQSFPDTIDCGYEETYVGGGVYSVNNRCEFSAYFRVYDARGSFVRQERIAGRSSGSTTIAAGESVTVLCTLVETIANEGCIVTKR